MQKNACHAAPFPDAARKDVARRYSLDVDNLAIMQFDDYSDADVWHRQVRPDFSLEARLPAQCDRVCWIKCA